MIGDIGYDETVLPIIFETRLTIAILTLSVGYLNYLSCLYIKGMKTTIDHIKEYFPGAGILIVSVADRDYKTPEGEVRTMPGIRNLVRYQQNLAAEEGVAFWNMFEAMGGNESMKTLVDAKPSMANYDYTHINVRGGRHLASLLFDALVYGKEQYDRRRAYEESR